ncbi:response regulator [Paenibacillaceae bacterium WGS1546]|uniref:response regulator n=1 Tax=Cohnella sp. WGS1546 TaxID=3366810 RepID=UPI00372D3072
MKAIVVDDEQPALESMARMLTRMGVEVAGAFQDPREALKAHASLAPDAAFVDIEMPELNGLELAARLQTENPRLQVVFATAYEQYAIEAFELAAVDYLLKPIQTNRLEKTVHRLLAARSAGETRLRRSTLIMFHRMTVRIESEESPELPWRTTKSKELFAYLAHCGDRPTGKDELVDILWPDVEYEKAVNYLHTCIYQIRQSLKNAGLALSIEYSAGRYRLALPPETLVDAQDWEKDVREAVEGNDDEKLQHLLLDVYRGDYLETEGYLWAEIERERLRTVWLDHALLAARRLEEIEAFGQAVTMHLRIQSMFPEVETSYFGLMRLFDRLGKAQEVQHHYGKLVRMMSEEFSMRPNERIVAWHDEWLKRRLS